ncbi:hypothetical protein HY408_01715 [Candidatus Gottesmanbacteria bacterium]|nr:hypothetical protein [Candidatus Gottesmanbacteria bacterium]
MKDGRTFIGVWIVNSLLFYFIPFLLLGLVVVGNARLSHFMASIISGFLMTLILTGASHVFTKFNINLKRDLEQVTANYFTNVIGIWLIARYADLTGVGITNAWIALGLGIMLTLAQWLLLTRLMKKKTSD